MRVSKMIALTGGMSLALTGALVPLTAFAGKDGVDVGPVFVPPVLESSSAAPASAAAVANEVNLARDFCSRLARKEYVIDCLAAELGQIADSMPAGGDYAPAKAALKDASVKLARIVTENQSTTLPSGTARDSGQSTPRPIRAVETDRLDEATAAAIGVIEETGTILLRSSETSTEAAGFVAISTAVRSNTILLRSI
jgi:hypothetical protein